MVTQFPCLNVGCCNVQSKHRDSVIEAYHERFRAAQAQVLQVQNALHYHMANRFVVEAFIQFFCDNLPL